MKKTKKVKAWISVAELNSCVKGMKRRMPDLGAFYLTLWLDKEEACCVDPRTRLTPLHHHLRSAQEETYQVSFNC